MPLAAESIAARSGGEDGDGRIEESEEITGQING